MTVSIIIMFPWFCFDVSGAATLNVTRVCASPCARPDDPGPSQPVRNPLHLCSPPAQVAMATQRLLRSIAPPSTGRAAAVETLADNDAKQRESAAIAAAKQLASWKPSSDPPPPKQRPPAKLSGAVVRESSALLDANALLMQHIRQARPNEPAPRTRAKRHTHTHAHTHTP